MRRLGLALVVLLPAAIASAESVRLDDGTAIIRGRVTAAENGRPLARAKVSLKGADRSLVADESGWFEFADLPGGRYEVRAASAGYLTSTYGESEPGGRPRVVEVSAGQVRSDINIALPKGAVITVTVTDELGAPMEGVWIQARELQSRGGRPSFKNVIEKSPRIHATDDRGKIRLFGLPPGDYYVSATESAFPPRIPDRGPAKNLRRLETFYPGVVRFADAKPVTLALGQEVNLEIRILQTPVVEVSGHVMREDGSVLPPFSVSMTPRSAGQFAERSPSSASSHDEFRFTSVLPGDYVISFNPESSNEAGSLDVSVSGTDVTDLVVLAKPAAMLKGRIELDTGEPIREWNEYDFTPIIVREDAPLQFSQISLRPESDGTFVVGGQTGRSVRWGGKGHGWYLKAVMRRGKDVTNSPVDFSAGTTIDDIRVVITREHTEVTGTARDGARKPTSEFTVVIFSEDRSQWTQDSPYVATADADDQGRFTVAGLPAGRYLAAAIDPFETYDPDVREPKSLERLTLHATPISLRAGERVSLTLDLVER